VNRLGLIVNTEVFETNGTAERDAALVMLEQIPGTKQVTVGGDKATTRRSARAVTWFFLICSCGSSG